MTWWPLGFNLEKKKVLENSINATYSVPIA